MFITLMRKHSKSIIIKVMVGFIAVVFVFWGVYSIRDRPGSKMAYVNGDLITGLEYEATYREMLDALQRQYKDYWNDALIKTFQIKQRALESLITKRLMSQEAQRLGLGVTDDELTNAILAYPAFQVDGMFDEGRYRSLLHYNRMEPADFESGIKLELLGQKIHHALKSFFPITDTEILHFYTYQKEKVKIAFVSFDPEDFKGKKTTTDTEKEEYFEKNKEKYRVPAKIKIVTLTVDPSDFNDKVTVSEQEISDFYQLNQANFTDPKKIKARHILFKLSPDAPESEVAQVKEKALALSKKLEKGEDFAKAAKEYSEGPTASKGGDLGYFKKGQMVKPFDDLAFKLKPGEIGGPVKTQFGWHLVKVEDIKEAETKTFSVVRDQIETELKNDICRDMANERILALMDQMPYDIDLASYAAKHGLTADESDYFSKNAPIPGMGEEEKLKKVISSLEKGEISEIIEHKGKFHIIQIVDQKDSYIPKKEEISPQLDKDLADHLALVAAKKEAESHLEGLRGGADWEELKKEKGVKTGEAGFFSRGESIPEIGYRPALHEAAFSLSAEKSYPNQVFVVNGKAYIIRWLERKDIDMKEFEKEKKAFTQYLTSSKEERVFATWLEFLRDKAEIKLVTPLE